MVSGFSKQVRGILLANGCRLHRQGKGDHEIWLCPGQPRPVVVDNKIMSRAVANVVLKQAGVDDRV